MSIGLVALSAFYILTAGMKGRGLIALGVVEEVGCRMSPGTDRWIIWLFGQILFIF